VSILTAIAPDPRRPGYRLVEVDRGRFASLPADALETAGVRVGDALSPRILELLHELADVEAAYRAGLKALVARGRARGDLERRLVRKQHPAGAVRQALERMAAQGLLDDAKFAREYVARQAARGRGPARLVGDLLGQGIDRRMAETAVAAGVALEGIDLDQALRNLAVRRAGQLRGLPRPTQKRRLLAYLARRGYPGAAVRELVEELVGRQ
jgi:regulatory protein